MGLPIGSGGEGLSPPSVETWQGAISPAKPFSGLSERCLVNHLAESPYFGVDTHYRIYIYTPFLSPTAHLLAPVILGRQPTSTKQKTSSALQGHGGLPFGLVLTGLIFLAGQEYA